MAESDYPLVIVTPEEEIFNERVYSLRAPAYEGNLGVLPGHAPMLCALQPGTLHIRREPDADEVLVAISGGFLEVNPERTVVLADAAEKPEEIDLDRAEQAYIRAFNLLYGPDADQEELDRERAEKALKRARARLHTAQKAGHDAEIPEMVQ